MAEFRSPNLNQRVQSPKSSLNLASNDDHLERPQARAARASAARRRAYEIVNIDPSPVTTENCLGRDQIIELFQNCIKLASENKINQKNTWELKLIDHLSEIIKVETDDSSETNFQKASCTLEAGVKIYSLRVDSVHAEAYKVLGRVIRAGREDIQDGADLDKKFDAGCSNKEKAAERKISPLSTLEPCSENFNVKKFNVAFAVDPLYNQTSALLDEGGAKGLLLNTLGVYGGCRLVFDSFEMPSVSYSTLKRNDVVDLSFIRDYVEQMQTNMTSGCEISPTLRDIVHLLDEEREGPPQTLNRAHEELGIDDAARENDEEPGVNAESFSFEEKKFPAYHEDDNICTSNMPYTDDTSGKVASFLFQGSEFMNQENAWAGPDHWKYHKPKGSRSGVSEKRSCNINLTDLDIEFLKSLEKSMRYTFAPMKNPKLLLLPADRVPWGRFLPEDCHYQPEDLVKLFLVPNFMWFLKGKGEASDKQFLQSDTDFDADNSIVGQYEDEASDFAGSSGLVSPPRQVNKIKVEYDKTSKHVDVHALKEALWNHINISIQPSEAVCTDSISFKHVLATFTDGYIAAASEDISPGLCFICLLHLANEYNLTISGCPSMDDLSVHLPSSFANDSS